MTEATTTPATARLADLPALSTPLAGGQYAGCTTLPNGTTVAIALLPGWAEGLTWQQATDWAAAQGGVLPSKAIAAQLVALVKPSLQPRLHWTSDECDASYAWYCYFDFGHQSDTLKSYEACAVAVRLIPLTA